MLINAKTEYNKQLERYKKAEEYFSRTDITFTEKLKYEQDFIDILMRLNYLLKEIGTYTEKEVLEGFNE